MGGWVGGWVGWVGGLAGLTFRNEGDGKGNCV